MPNTLTLSVDGKFYTIPAFEFEGGVDNVSDISSTGGKVYYVDERNGSNLNLGTEYAPFRSLTFARSRAKAGDYIVIIIH